MKIKFIKDINSYKKITLKTYFIHKPIKPFYINSYLSKLKKRTIFLKLVFIM